MTDSPPVRLSVDHPDYTSEVGQRIEVLLNGSVQGNVISYDVEARTIVRYATDASGDFILEGDDAKVETLTGDVAVRWSDQP